jgi:hypothetical protein
VASSRTGEGGARIGAAGAYGEYSWMEAIASIESILIWNSTVETFEEQTGLSIGTSTTEGSGGSSMVDSVVVWNSALATGTAADGGLIPGLGLAVHIVAIPRLESSFSRIDMCMRVHLRGQRLELHTVGSVSHRLEFF